MQDNQPRGWLGKSAEQGLSGPGMVPFHGGATGYRVERLAMVERPAMGWGPMVLWVGQAGDWGLWNGACQLGWMDFCT